MPKTPQDSSNSQPGIVVSKTPANTSSIEASPKSPDQNPGVLSADSAEETGLNATASAIRGQSLHPENKKSAHNLIDRMYWSHEENVDRTVSVDDKGSLEDL
jgi:hypothetical protein